MCLVAGKLADKASNSVWTCAEQVGKNNEKKGREKYLGWFIRPLGFFGETEIFPGKKYRPRLIRARSYTPSPTAKGAGYEFSRREGKSLFNVFHRSSPTPT